MEHDIIRCLHHVPHEIFLVHKMFDTVGACLALEQDIMQPPYPCVPVDFPHKRGYKSLKL